MLKRASSKTKGLSQYLTLGVEGENDASHRYSAPPVLRPSGLRIKSAMTDAALWIPASAGNDGASRPSGFPLPRGTSLRRVADFHHCVASSYLVVSYSARRE